MPRAIGSLTKYPARFSLLSYASLIFVGTVLLSLPAAVATGHDRLTAVDALFTATSALCVTGLTVRSTAHDLSVFGQAVVLSLIQIGGIGIVTITTFFTFQLGRKAGLRDRAMVSEALGAIERSDLRGMLWRVLGYTLAVELGGAVLLLLRHLGQMSWPQAAGHALFHSISAYCNAGFALYDDSLVAFQGDALVNATIGMLIVAGGLGFPVVLDLRRSWRQGRKGIWDRLHLHSKMMLIGTLLLLSVGTCGFLVLEHRGVLAGMPWPRRVMVALFSAVTARTAGFNTVDLAALTNATLFMTMLLMIIGAGPCSTGGGMKVTTFMVLVLFGWTTWQGREKISLMRRTVAPRVVHRAITTVLLFGAMMILAVTALLVIEQSSSPHRSTSGVFLETVFEAISALGTVGLSTGITSNLSTASRLVLIILMFIGRLGPISVAVALSRRQERGRAEFPETELLIG